MSTTELEIRAGAVCHAYGRYVGSGAYWRDRRRQRRMAHEAYLGCVRSDLKRFREKVVSALAHLEAEITPMEALAETLRWLRPRIDYARHDMTVCKWEGSIDGAWGARDQCRHEKAIEVAECLVETIRLQRGA